MTLFTEQLPVSLDQQNDLQRAIHRTHWEERLGILQALGESYNKGLLKQARQLSACGQAARLYLDPEAHTVKTLIHRCKNRICPWCTHSRTAHAVKQIMRTMAHMENPRTIVLTARSTERPLDEQITAMRAAFVRLRRDSRWKKMVNGGIYTVEITWNAGTARWHPHIHLIVDGNFFPQPLLSKMWAKASDGSDIVWVKAIPDRTSAALELAAYIGKPPKIKAMPYSAVRDYAAATRGIRMLQAFGRMHGLKLTDEDTDFTPPGDSATISVNRIKYLAGKQQPEAVRLAHFIPQRWPVFRGFFQRPIDQDHAPPAVLLPDQVAEIMETINADFSELLGQQDSGLLDRYDQEYN